MVLARSEPKQAGWARWSGLATDAFLIASAALFLVWAIHWRVDYINGTFGKAIGCVDCMSYSVLVHDLVFAGTLLGLLFASFWIRRYWLHLPIRLLYLAGLVVYVGDIVIMEDFFTRLNIHDVTLYGSNFEMILRYIQSTGLWNQKLWMLVPLFAWAMLFIAKPPSGFIKGKSAVLLLALPASGILAGSVLSPPSYVHDWALRNVIKANLSAGVTTAYSEAFSRSVLIDHAEKREMRCRSGQDRSPDIVLLILESWSPYQSQLFSGLKDWTPELDRLARNNTWYARMHAAGFSTNEGLISLLTGLDFIAPQKSWFEVRPFETAWDTPQTIPKVLKQSGNYFTAFLSSWNLAFSKTGDWYRNLGFDYLEGHDHPAYDAAKERLHFDSVPDRMLYDRSVDYISELKQKEDPFFVTIESVSTHHPHIHPETGERSQEAVFRYMDSTVAEFHSGLESMEFFDNGLLIIVSDHRAMLPISQQEQDRFGRASASLIPAIIIGDAAPGGKIERRFHQSDLLPSLAALTSAEYCHQGPFRSMLQPERSESRCVYHARGDDRDYLDAFCPEGAYIVELDGDRTRVIQSASDDPVRTRQILKEINTLRIVGQQRESLRTQIVPDG